MVKEFLFQFASALTACGGNVERAPSYSLMGFEHYHEWMKDRNFFYLE